MILQVRRRVADESWNQSNGFGSGYCSGAEVLPTRQSAWRSIEVEVDAAAVLLQVHAALELGDPRNLPAVGDSTQDLVTLHKIAHFIVVGSVEDVTPVEGETTVVLVDIERITGAATQTAAAVDAERFGVGVVEHVV